MAGSSDHDLIYLTYGIDAPTIPIETGMFRDFKRCNISDLLIDAGDYPWHFIGETADMDEQVGIMASHIEKLFDMHVPLRSFSPKPDFNHISVIK